MKKKILKILSLILSLSFLLLIFTSCSITMGNPNSEENLEKEKIKKIEDSIKKSKLQYPAKNESFHYNVYEDYIAITKYCGTETEVVVPEKIEDLPVYVLKDEVFREMNVTKIKIAEGIIEIGENCFRSCEELEEILLPKSLRRIGDNAMAQCSSLIEITFPENLSVIPYSVCYECKSLKTVTILSKIEESSIEDSAFLRCSLLENVYMTEKIERIASTAFTDISPDVVFHAPKGCAAAQYCADKLFAYRVVENADKVEETTENGEIVEETTTEDDAGMTEDMMEIEQN